MSGERVFEKKEGEKGKEVKREGIRGKEEGRRKRTRFSHPKIEFFHRREFSTGGNGFYRVEV